MKIALTGLRRKVRKPWLTRTAAVLPWGKQGGFAEDLQHLRLHGLQPAGFQQFHEWSAGDEDEIHVPLERLVIGSKGLPKDALHPIPIDGGTKPLRYREPDSRPSFPAREVQAPSARNSIGPDTCWQQTGPRGRRGQSPQIAKAGRETDPP